MISKNSVVFFSLLVIVLRSGSCESIQSFYPAMDENESMEVSLRTMMTESLFNDPIYKASFQLKEEYKQQIILKYREIILEKRVLADRLYHSLVFKVIPSRNVSLL